MKTFKVIYKTIFLAVLAAGFTACNLDEDLKSVYGKQNAWKTQENAIEGVNGIYQSVHLISTRVVFNTNDLPTDAAYYKEMDAELMNDNALPSSLDISRSWLTYYQIVGRSNDVIDNVVNIPDEIFVKDKPSKARLLAEAHFMRAYAYYQLSDLFYTVPLVTNSWLEASAKVPPATIEEIDTQIETDLLFAKNELPEKYASIADGGRPTLGAVYGFLTRLHMRAAGRERMLGGSDEKMHWTAALQYVDKVLELENKGVYKLQNHAWDVFNPLDDAHLYNNEIIFAIRSSKNNPSGSSDLALTFTPWEYNMGWNLLWVPMQLVWMYEQGDERLSANLVGTDNKPMENTPLLVTSYANVYNSDPKKTKKEFYRLPMKIEEVGTIYNDKEPNKITHELIAAYTNKYYYADHGTYNYNTNNNMIVMRLADIILCKAEILNELNGPNAESIRLINLIRSRAFQNASHGLELGKYPGKEALRSAICDERLLELHNEALRRPDLIRMGLWKDRMDKYMDGIQKIAEMRKKHTGNDYTSEWKVYPKFSGNGLKTIDKRMYFPVPKRESDMNPLLNNCRSFTEMP